MREKKERGKSKRGITGTRARNRHVVTATKKPRDNQPPLPSFAHRTGKSGKIQSGRQGGMWLRSGGRDQQ